MGFKIKLFVEMPDGRQTGPVTLAEPAEMVALHAGLHRIMSGFLRDGPNPARSLMDQVRYLDATPNAGAVAKRQDAVIVPPGEGHKYSDRAFWENMLPGEFAAYSTTADEDEGDF